MLHENIKSCQRLHNAQVNEEKQKPKFAKSRPTTAYMLARRDITDS
jgi:hypothetical protein